MSTDIDIKSYSVISSLTAMVLSALFIVTACSTFISARDAESQKASSTAVATSADVVPRANEQGAGHSESFDKAMDEWQKARAAYLRTLDYAQIEQQNTAPQDYLLKSNLIESRYHIKTSETAMYVEHDYRKALQELKVAEQQFVRAIKMASSAELNKLDATKPNMDSLLVQAKLSVKHDSVYPEPNGYRQVETQIEKLIATL
ncbi:MAG: hypothetical protein LJE85_06585 [Gammaproteobacteria bacterium]|nr:hypothetical protein [Gammaproteobacteria bacterium]